MNKFIPPFKKKGSIIMKLYYKGVSIYSKIVCYDIRYFVGDEFFRHFSTIELAKKYIDER